MKKISGYKASMAVVAVAMVAACSPIRSIAQPPPASVHGHVQNAAGFAIMKGDVKFTKDKTSKTFQP